MKKTNEFQIDISKILKELNDWYELYYCIYYNNRELNSLLLEFKDSFPDIQEQEAYLMVFFHLKIKINDYHYRTKTFSNLTEEENEFKRINDIIQNYIDLLEFNIKSFSEKAKEKREKFRVKYVYFSIFFTIFSIIFSSQLFTFFA